MREVIRLRNNYYFSQIMYETWRKKMNKPDQLTEAGEIISLYENFNGQGMPLEEKAKDKIIVKEIKALGVSGEAPQGVRKLNLLV